MRREDAILSSAGVPGSEDEVARADRSNRRMDQLLQDGGRSGDSTLRGEIVGARALE